MKQPFVEKEEQLKLLEEVQKCQLKEKRKILEEFQMR